MTAAGHKGVFRDDRNLYLHWGAGYIDASVKMYERTLEMTAIY